MEPRPAHLTVEALRARLEQRIASLYRPVVADVMRVFVEVSLLDCELALWSLEFAFDEDDGRVARFEAQFADWDARDPSTAAVRGYELRVLLPRVIPARGPIDGVRAAERALDLAGRRHGTLVARFVRALSDLGAYRTIEPLEALSVEAYLLD